MEIDLTAVAVLGGALGVGIGLFLLQIAANFGSGIILLLEYQSITGDHVEMDGGGKGSIVKMTATACVLEAFNGKPWILVPNAHFNNTRRVNHSDARSADRCEAAISVSAATALNLVPARIGAALPSVRQAPDCQRKGSGESAVDFPVKYRVERLDGGIDKHAGPVLVAIRNALNSHGIRLPHPQRAVEIKGQSIG